MNWKKLSHLSIKKIEGLQNKKLRYFLQCKVPFSPYYKKLFKQHKIKFSDIKTTKDLEKLPFTTKSDIASTKKYPEKYDGFVLKPNKKELKIYSSTPDLLKYTFNRDLILDEFKPVHVHFTTGRTANAIPFLYTRYDLEKIREAGRRIMDITNSGRDDRLVSAYPYAPHLGFWQRYFTAEASGIFALHTGGGKILGTDRIIKAIESTKASSLAFMPGYGYHMLRTAKRNKANFSSIKKVFCGAGSVSEGLREKIKSMLTDLGSENPQVFASYGFTEGKVIWIECEDYSGYHLFPDMGFIEIVDDKSERVGEGEKGELVYTSLDFRGSIVLRYKTGDICRITYKKCNCGRTVPRISSEIERKSDIKGFNLTKVKDTFVNLNIFHGLLHHKNIEEWQVEIRKKHNNPYEVDELVIYITPKREINFTEFKKELKHLLYEELQITPEIVKMDLKKLVERLGMETELKEKRIIDNRRLLNR